MSAGASAEGLIWRSLFTIEKSAWLSPNGPNPPPSRLPPRLSRRPRAAWGWRPGARPAATQTPESVRPAKGEGVPWASGGGPGGLKMGAFSWRILGAPDGEASVLFRCILCPPQQMAALTGEGTSLCSAPPRPQDNSFRRRPLGPVGIHLEY